jgi:hypothetical protein
MNAPEKGKSIDSHAYVKAFEKWVKCYGNFGVLENCKKQEKSF